MAEPLTYRDLDMARVEAVFKAEGELLLTLSPHHARACIDFIRMIRAVQGLRRDRVPRVRLLGHLAGGLVLLLRIMVGHSRLFEMARVLVLWSASKEWQELPNGSYLFRFAKRTAER